MKPRSTLLVFTGISAVSLLTWQSASAKSSATDNSTPGKRGEYIVKTAGCNDCHTPLKMGPSGPERDWTRLLSGHPAGLAMPPAPKLAPDGPWMATVSATMTAWSGPWGTSFTPNLTPDKETGIGGWSERNFVDAIRSGRHMGRGRPILPPMPWQTYTNFTDGDLKAIFAYLQSIPAVKNRVPDPILAPAPAPAAQK
jgi:hypothetical protein